MNYTKGKWTSQDKLASYTGTKEPKTIVSVDEAGKLVVIAILGENKEKAANSALIEAAPAMYEALQYIRLKLRDLSEDQFSSDWTTDVLNEIRKFDSQEHPLPTDYNQEQTKLYSIREHNGTDIVSFVRESDGCYFELGRMVKVVYGNTSIKTGRITKIFASDKMSTGMGIEIDGQGDSDASLLQHVTPTY